MIDYNTKITTHRQMYEISDLNYSIESDRWRILSAPALRRLQKKTQVFPLELNAAVRSRLTHSLEVAQTARFIAKTILQKSKNQFGLEALQDAFISTSEMTSLLHDIGNPPFGHFAEIAINDWMSKRAVQLFETCVKVDKKHEPLKTMLLHDLCNFDGNAQAIRVICKLQRLNLSYTQIASVIKYTRGAYEQKPTKDEPHAYLRKKPGFYYSEKEIVQEVSQTLNIKPGCRFPLTYIMEAADDISYLNADIEDAVDKGILTFEDVYQLITAECQKQNEVYLQEIVTRFYNKAKSKEDEPYQFNLFFTLTRAELTRDLVNHTSDVYLANHEAIFKGEFNHALLEFDEQSKYTKAINILQTISINHIYNNQDIETLELKGYKILTSLLDCYTPLLQLSFEDFSKLIKAEKINCYMSNRLIRRLSSKHIVAYKNSIENLSQEDMGIFKIEEWYYRARLILDYISGMTDDFAYDEYKTLNALK